MPLPPRRVTNPEWRHWLSEAPGLPSSGQVDLFHREALAWLRRSPSPDVLSREEANDLIQYLMLINGRLNRQQREGVDIGDTLFVSAAVSLIAALALGPAGLIAGPVYSLGAAAYERKLQVDHRRRQNMIREIEEKIDALVEWLRQ